MRVDRLNESRKEIWRNVGPLPHERRGFKVKKFTRKCAGVLVNVRTMTMIYFTTILSASHVSRGRTEIVVAVQNLLSIYLCGPPGPQTRSRFLRNLAQNRVSKDAFVHGIVLSRIAARAPSFCKFSGAPQTSAYHIKSYSSSDNYDSFYLSSWFSLNSEVISH